MKKTFTTTGFVMIIAVIFMTISSFMVTGSDMDGKTPGTVTFTVRTVTAGGNYGPKHVLALWVEDAGGFVKTRLLRAEQRKQYLYKWVASSNYNIVDAVTGPTLTSHTTHTITWDCTDLNGDEVPDGDYTIFAEFTEKHGQGPWTSVTFTKGPDPITLTIPDEAYFKDMYLEFNPVSVDFIGEPTEVCQGDEVTFTDLSAGASSWEWDFGEGANPQTAITQGPHTITYDLPGPKTVSLTINDTYTETKPDYIGVTPAPSADFTYEIVGLSVTFTNTSLNATSYQWDFGDGITSSEINPVHTYEEAGTYLVMLTASYLTCNDEASKSLSVMATGLFETMTFESSVLWPNPSEGVFTIKGADPYTGPVSLDVFDYSGRKVRSFRIDNHDGNHPFQVNLSDLPEGIYLFNIINDGKTTRHKAILQR